MFKTKLLKKETLKRIAKGIKRHAPKSGNSFIVNFPRTKPKFKLPDCTVTFKDHGQDFLEWDIENGVVVGCRPFQGSVWGGRRVMNLEPIKVGDAIAILTKHSGIIFINYLVRKVEALKPAHPGFVPPVLRND